MSRKSIKELRQEAHLLRKQVWVAFSTNERCAVSLEEQCLTLPSAVHRVQGVYFLLRRNIVVYVGASDDVVARCVSHRKPSYRPNKDFDDCKWLKFDSMHEAAVEELRYMLKYRPQYNGKPAVYRGVNHGDMWEAA